MIGQKNNFDDNEDLDELLDEIIRDLPEVFSKTKDRLKLYQKAMRGDTEALIEFGRLFLGQKG